MTRQQRVVRARALLRIELMNREGERAEFIHATRYFRGSDRAQWLPTLYYAYPYAPSRLLPSFV